MISRESRAGKPTLGMPRAGFEEAPIDNPLMKKPSVRSEHLEPVLVVIIKAPDTIIETARRLDARISTAHF
jgi:hypothetical protein